MFIVIHTMNIPDGYCKLFELKITNYGTSDANITQVIDDFLSDIETKIENDSNSKNVDIPDIGKYLKGVGTANSMSTKGAGAFYAQNIKNFGIGLSMGLAIDLGTQSFASVMNGNIDADAINGGAFNPLLSIAFSSNPAALKKRVYIIHGVYFDNKIMKNGIGSKHINAGFLIQNKIVDRQSTPLELMEWSGVDFNIGINHTYLDLAFTKSFRTSTKRTISLPNVPLANNIEVTANVVGPYTVGVQSSQYSIPIEFVTGFKLAKFFTQYLGLASDINIGKTQTYAHASPDIEFEDNNPLLVLPTVKTQVNFLANQSKSNDIFDFRLLTGFSLNSGPIGFFVHFNKSLLKTVVSLSMGLKVLL